MHALQMPTARLSWNRKQIVAVLAAVTIAACDGPSTISPTDASPPGEAPPTSAPRTVTGSVWLHSPTGRQPFAGAEVWIWLELPRAAQHAGSVTSDSAGRFSLRPPVDALVRLYTRPNGMYQPCLSTVRVDQTEVAIRLVAESHVLQAREWPDFAVERLLSGTIFEAAQTGRLPIADAWVQVDGVMGDGRPLADTRSDANGRFVVCGLEGETQIPHALVVSKQGYGLATVDIPTQGAGPVDVQLSR
jgi:hypothetical protein